MIMILDVDVTAERRHYNTYRPAGDTTPSAPQALSPLERSEHNPPPSGGHNPRSEAPSTFPSEPFEPFEPSEPGAAQRPFSCFFGAKPWELW